METLQLTVADCKKQCPVCCIETAEEIAARTDANVRMRALTLSSAVSIMVVTAHIYFSYFNKTLPMPDIVWAIILAPWGGAAVSKVAAVLTGKK